MAKLSEQKKVELLENTVLTGTVEELIRVLEEYAPFEFTARALGYAARFRGAETVRCLIDHGATFAYEISPAFVKKYGVKTAISNAYSYNTDYSLYLLKDRKIDPNLEGVQIIGDAERASVLELLHTSTEKTTFNEVEILYYSILYGDTAIRNTCAKLGICKLSDSRAANIRCDVNYAHMDGVEKHFRDEFTWTLRKTDAENRKRILKDILPLLGEKQMQMMPADLFDDWMDKKEFFSVYCAEGLFDLVIKHTNLADKVKKWDILYALVDQNNAAGVQYALEQEWISKPKDLEALLKYAQSKESANAALIGSILDHLEKTKPAQKETETLALAKNPMSATEMKKIWGFKKLADGSLIITGYKGEAVDVIVPEMIGKDTVTALNGLTFNSAAPRITKEQAEIRKNIQSVEIPGTVREIPDQLFFDGYREFGHTVLKRVVLHEGTEFLGKSCFADCTGLEEIVLPETLKGIGDDAFKHCKSMKNIDLPAGLATLGRNAFADCELLKTLILPAHVTELPSGIFSSDGWFNGCAFEEFTVPEQITKMGYSAFSGCKKLNKVVLSQKMTEIPRMAFEACEALEYILIPSEVTAISEDAFRGCTKVIIHAPAGSYAEKYAKENNIPFMAE